MVLNPFSQQHGPSRTERRLGARLSRATRAAGCMAVRLPRAR